jgi:hypothetical protein
MARVVGDAVVVTDRTRYYLDGVEVSEKRYRRRHPPPRADAVGYGRTAKVQRSIALAVHPSQRKEAIEDAIAKGVPTHFTEDGRPEFTSREHRKRYFRAYGFFDRDAGYGDQAPERHKGKTPPPNPLTELRRRLAGMIRVRRESRTDG